MKDAFEKLFRAVHQFKKLNVSDLIPGLSSSEFSVMGAILQMGENGKITSSELAAKIEERYKDRNLVVLLDLPGGSPANTALPFMSSSRKLIAGVNLPLVLEIMAMKKSGTTWEELDLDDTCKSAAQSIVLYNNFLNGGNV